MYIDKQVRVSNRHRQSHGRALHPCIIKFLFVSYLKYTCIHIYTCKYIIMCACPRVTGKVTEGGFWNSAYGVSKMGVTQYTRLAAKTSSAAGTDVLISSCCPGLCRTGATSLPPLSFFWGGKIAKYIYIYIYAFCSINISMGRLFLWFCWFSVLRGVLWCVVVCCGVLWCVAVCCCVFPCVAACRSVLQCVAVCPRLLPCVAGCCRVL